MMSISTGTNSTVFAVTSITMENVLHLTLDSSTADFLECLPFPHLCEYNAYGSLKIF